MGSQISQFTEGISSKMAATMAEKQKEAGMAQREAQAKMMEQNMKRQLAMQMAAQREMFYWEAGAYGFFLTVMTMRLLMKHPFERVLAIPLLIPPYIMAYQYDFAFGNKSDRIKKETDHILETEKHWFTEKK